MLDGIRSLVSSARENGQWVVQIRNEFAPDDFVNLFRNNAAIRGNWVYMRVWRWLADAAVYLVLFLSLSGIYLWAVLRAERRTGLALIAAGAFSVFGLVYALIR